MFSLITGGKGPPIVASYKQKYRRPGTRKVSLNWLGGVNEFRNHINRSN